MKLVSRIEYRGVCGVNICPKIHFNPSTFLIADVFRPGVLVAQMSSARLSACILISHKGNNNTIHIYSMTVMTHVKSLQAGQSSQPGDI